MKVLVACEFSGRVRDSFTEQGHFAVSCDLLPSEGKNTGFHYQGDVNDILDYGWDMMIAFPPCTHLSKAGARFWKEKQANGVQQEALGFVRMLMNADIPRIAIENPVGAISTFIRKPDQKIQPYQFGDPWKKETCLWLKNLPALVPTDIVEPVGHWVDGGGTRKSYRNKNEPYPLFADNAGDRALRPQRRSYTFPGIAKAMASQWG